ncbi:MAG: hypothetical protein SynsKO_45150 [Synoicihabitans sp.]
MKLPVVLLSLFLGGFATLAVHAESPSRIETIPFTSEILAENKIGLDLERDAMVYLPPGYDEAPDTRFPVIYYLHNFWWSNAQLFEDGVVQATFDRAIANGVIRPFILVAADYTSPTTGSFYPNSPVTGRMQDYTIEEVVPLIDSRYRTIPHRDGRGVTGDFVGAYGAMRFAMFRPDIFGTVYGLHPVATGEGPTPGVHFPNWELIHGAKSFADLAGHGREEVFVTMAQDFAPNVNRPPLFADFMMEPNQAGDLVVHHENYHELNNAFLLNRMAGDYVENLRSLNGIKFDWGRFDQTYSHVHSNRQFCRLLFELGVEVEAEEYQGNTWEHNWTEYGRVYTSLLPFFERHLASEPAAAAELRERSARYTEALREESLEGVLALTTVDALVLPEYQPPLDSASLIASYYTQFFATTETKSVIRETERVEQFGDHWMEIGHFSHRYRLGEAEPFDYVGKYMTWWRRDSDGVLRMVANIWGASEWVDAKDLAVAEVERTSSAPARPSTPAELAYAERAAFVYDAVRVGDAKKQLTTYRDDAIYMTYYDPPYVGKGAITDYFTAHYDPDNFGPSELEIAPYRFIDLGDYLLVHGRYRVGWTQDDGDYHIRGKGLALWSKNGEGPMMNYRQMINHDMPPTKQ